MLEFVGFLAIALAVAAYVWGIAIFFAMTFMPTYGSVEWWRVWSARLMARWFESWQSSSSRPSVDFRGHSARRFKSCGTCWWLMRVARAQHDELSTVQS
jgi:hypothetical protein